MEPGISLLVKQDSIIPVPSEDGICPAGSWSISGTEQSQCSALNTNLCDTIAPGADIEWANTQSDGLGGQTSTDGMVRCSWAPRTPDSEDILSAIENRDDVRIDPSRPINLRSQPSISKCARSVTPHDCPTDLITQDKERACTRVIGYLNDTYSYRTRRFKQFCESLYRKNDPTLFKELKNNCNIIYDYTGDCLCLNPGMPIVSTDKIMSKKVGKSNPRTNAGSVYRAIIEAHPELEDNKEAWYIPCKSGRYIKPPPPKKKISRTKACSLLVPELKALLKSRGLSQIEYNELLARTTCSDNDPTNDPNNNSNTLKNDWQKYKWYIIIGLIVFFAIIILLVALGRGKKKKSK